MPTYEYRCPEGHAFELVQRMSDPPRTKCPTCGAEAERLLSAGAGFLFKGDGFYITDYRSEGYKKAAKAESGASGTAPAKEGAKGASDASSGGGAASPAPSSSSSSSSSSTPAGGGS